MRDSKPGDLVYVPGGTLLKSAVDNEEHWNMHPCPALVIATGLRVVETDEGICGLITVFVNDIGLYFVEEAKLLSPDEYEDPARLFPPTRLREW